MPAIPFLINSLNYFELLNIAAESRKCLSNGKIHRLIYYADTLHFSNSETIYKPTNIINTLQNHAETTEIGMTPLSQSILYHRLWENGQHFVTE